MQRKNWIKFFIVSVLGSGIFMLLSFIQANATDTVTVYVTPAITDAKILPTSTISSSYLSDTITIKASPGEYEPATFTVKANNTITDMTVAVSNLASGGNTISSSNVDVKVVKIWWQAGTTFNTGTKTLTPELLLKNDDLVTIGTDSADNYLTVTSTPIKISDPAGIGGWGTAPTIDQFPVQDTATLQPVDITNGQQKQFWITVQVPAGATAGTYTGTITLSSGGLTLKTLNLNLTVYPITLAAPNLEYSLYYDSYITTTGTIGGNAKTETQVRAELTNLKNHGINNPAIGQYVSTTSSFANMLNIRQELGFSNTTVYFEGAGGAFTATDPVSTSTITAYKDVATQYGATNFYMFALDEQDLTPYTNKMDQVHALGVKMITAQNTAQATAIANRLDTATIYGLDSTVSALLHSYGNKAFLYGTPFTADESPLTDRRNYGFSLWRYDYDGEMSYIYQVGVGNIWDDFDGGRNVRDINFTYPTINSVIDTIQYEGFREAIDDARYLATLQSLIAINTASGAKSVSGANRFLNDFKTMSLLTFASLDLDAVRENIAAYILYFLGEGAEPVSVIPSTCGNNIRTQAEECDGTDLNSKTCANFGYTGGTLTCRPISCYFNKSACTPPLPFLVNYDNTSDFDGYVNRNYANIKVSVTSTYDATAYADFVDASSTLIAHWPFNENSGTAANDATSNRNNGVITYGDIGTADAGTTETVIKETGYYLLSAASSTYNGWTFLATSGAASGTSRTISSYTVNSTTDKDITLASALTGFAAGDAYRIYQNASGPSFTTGKFGNGVQLDGIDDFVLFNCSPAPVTSDISGSYLTISMWFNPSRVTGTQYLILENLPYQLYLNGANLVGKIYRNAWIMANGVNTVTTNTWHHVALVYNKGSVYLYLDGVLDKSNEDNSSWTDAQAAISGDDCAMIGRSNAGSYYQDGTNYFQGSVDDIMFFKRALSAGEVRSLYNAQIFPLVYQTGTLKTNAPSLLSAFVVNTNGDSQQTATRTINVSSHSSASDLNLSGLGMPSTSTFKFLAGTEWDRFVAKTSSTFEATALTGKKLDIGSDSASLLQLIPSGGEANLYFDTSNYLSSGYVNRWIVSSSVPSTQVSASIKVPNDVSSYYEIKVDGVHYDYVGSTPGGYVNFSYNGGFSTKNFTIQAYTSPQRGYATSTIINGVEVSLIESTATSTTFTATSTPSPVIVPEISTSTPLESVTSTFVIVKEETTPAETPKETLYIKELPSVEKLLKNDIAGIQDRLKELGFFPKDIDSTGYFGPITIQAVKEFQKLVNIFPSGIIGPRTTKALNGEQFITNKDYKFMEDLSYGSQSQAVKELQTRLRDQNFFPYNVPSTGYFGSITLKALKIFQSFFNLIPTGIFDALTRGVMNR